MIYDEASLQYTMVQHISGPGLMGRIWVGIRGMRGWIGDASRWELLPGVAVRCVWVRVCTRIDKADKRFSPAGAM